MLSFVPGFHDRVGHVALVVGGVAVLAVPATGRLETDVELHVGTARAGGGEVDVEEAVPALPALDEAFVGAELLGALHQGVTDDVPQPPGERPHAGVVGDARLVVDDLRAHGEDLLVPVVQRGHPVGGGVGRCVAGGVAAVEARRGAAGVRRDVAHEGVVVGPAGLSRVDDRVVRRSVGDGAVGLELLVVARRRGRGGRGHAGDLGHGRYVTVAVGVVGGRPGRHCRRVPAVPAVPAVPGGRGGRDRGGTGRRGDGADAEDACEQCGAEQQCGEFRAWSHRASLPAEVPVW
ncbi:hypothetical protein STENM223S_02464 [Streptomyces tendae]